MKYKISQEPLKLREFGRNIQSMVDYARSIDDRDTRTRVVNEIIKIMTNLNPNLKENPDYKQKLWDAVFLICENELDVDAPYPKPKNLDIFLKGGKKVPYQKGRPKYRQYGNHVHLMIGKAIEMEEGPYKADYINQIANTMKLFLKTMDRDSIQEEIIAEHMNDISGGKIRVQAEDLTLSKVALNPPLYNQPTTHKPHHRNNNGNKNNHGNNYANKRKNNKRRRKN
ncbi:MAG: DUF4290 domain-containing protein [Bacteroidia bacterium]|nr:DUF4290 domain-containing protein [Bacteroidia bacterium]